MYLSYKNVTEKPAEFLIQFIKNRAALENDRQEDAQYLLM